MAQNKKLWSVFSQREVSDSEILEMAKEFKGKTEEEQHVIAERYAEKWAKTCPKREHPLMMK